MNSCVNSYDFNYLDTPEFFTISLHFLALVAFPVYIFTAYLILWKTPLSMKSVKISLLIFHFWTCFVDVVFSILVSPFPLAPLYAGYPLGVLRWLGVAVEHQAMFAMASTEAMLVSILGVYENRFFILTHYKQWWRPIRIPWYIFNYLLAFVAFIPIYYLIPDQTHSRDFILQRLPCLSSEILSGGTLFLVTEDVSLMLRSASTVSSIIAFQGFVFFVLVMRTLNQYGTQLSKKTVDMQKKFLKSMILQLLVPAICITFPFAYLWYSGRFKYYNQKFTNFSVILISSHGLFASLFMLYIQVSYRKVILENFIWFIRFFGVKITIEKSQEERSVFKSRMSKIIMF